MDAMRSPVRSLLGAVLAAVVSTETVLAGLPAGWSELDERVRDALAATAAAATTHEVLVAPLDPWQVGRLAAALNPEAAAALARVRQELLAVRKELGLPDVMLEVEARHFTRLPDFNSMQGNMLALSRTFPLGGKLSRRALVAFGEAESAFHEYRGLLQDLLKDARIAAAELYSAQRQAAILQENIRLSLELAEISKVKYTTGLRTQQDVLKAQTEAVRYENERLEKMRMADSARAMVNALLARSHEAPVPEAAAPRTVPLSLSAGDLEAKARAWRPELAAARAAVEKATATVAVARAEKHRPDLTGQVGYMQRPDEEPDGWQARVGINLPWFNRRHDREVEEATEGRSAAEKRYESAWNKARFEVRDTWLRVRESEESVELFRARLLPQAQQTFDASRAGYETDQIDFLSLVDAQRALEDMSMAHVRAVAELARRQAELDRAVGDANGALPPPVLRASPGRPDRARRDR